jgi:hypothetical protein
MRPCLRLAIATVLGMAVGGCPAEPTPPGPDGGGGDGGLSIVWESRPSPIPSEPSSDIAIERASFLLEGLRVVSDGGSLELELKRLAWSRDGAPGPVPVKGASPGIYSRLLFELEGEEDDQAYAYEITGTVKINGTVYPFTIRDLADINLAVEFSFELRADDVASIPVRVEIDKLVEAVRFETLTREDGRYVVDEGAPLEAVRAQLKKSFSVHDPS